MNETPTKHSNALAAIQCPVFHTCTKKLKCFLRHLPNHPSNLTVRAPVPPRNIKKDLVRTYPEVIYKVSPDGFTAHTHKGHLEDLYHDTVMDVLRNYPTNIVLESKPTPIHKSEAKLPRQTRVTVSWSRLRRRKTSD